MITEEQINEQYRKVFDSYLKEKLGIDGRYSIGRLAAPFYPNLVSVYYDYEYIADRDDYNPDDWVEGFDGWSNREMKSLDIHDVMNYIKDNRLGCDVVVSDLQEAIDEAVHYGFDKRGK